MKILLTGGAACGKSTLAEDIVLALGGPLTYIATMRPLGDEGQAKVLKHRNMRDGKGFTTVECYGNLAAVKLDPQGGTVLLECLTNLAADELYEEDGTMHDSEEAFSSIMQGIRMLEEQCEHLVLITNDVGSDGIKYSQETQSYIELLGRVNCACAAQCDFVLECVCGVPQFVRGSSAEFDCLMKRGRA